MPSKVERWLASKAKKQEGTATDKIRADRALDSGSEEFRVGAELDRYVGKASALAPYSPAPTTEQTTYVEQTPLERKEQTLVSAARQRAEKRKTAGDDYYKKEYGMTKAEYDKEYDAIDRMSAVREARSDMQEIEDTAKARTEEKVALAPLVKEYKDAFIGILPESAYAWHSPVGDKEEIKEDIVLDYLMTLPAEKRYAQLEKAAYRSTIVPRIEALKEKATQFMNKESERITAMQKHVPVPSYSAAAGMQLGASGTWESPVEYLEDLYTSVKKDDFKSGFVEAADWRDFISFGLASLGGDAAKLQALQKAHKGEPLTEQDEFFIEVAEIEQALEDFRKEKGGASFWNSLGSGAAHSAQFVTETVTTGGIGGAAKAATSGVKQAFKQGIRQGLKQLTFKNVPRTIVYGAKRSPLMAGTYRNLMDRRINQYSVANGQVDLTNPESLWKSIGVAWADQSFEIASELWGNMLHLGFGKIGKAIGADKWLKTKSVSLKTTPAMRRVLRDGLLWSGDMPSEITSEFLGDVATNLAYSAFNEDEQYWGELFTWNYWGNLLALTAGLKAGVTVASIPSIVDSNKKVKQLEARSAEAFNAIGNEELKNKVLNLGGRTDIEDVAEYMHSIDWSQYKPIEVAHAIDYMMSEVERQVVAGSEAEQERAERYAPRLERIQELAYRNAEGVAMPTMVTAEANFGVDNTQGVTILEGDYNNPEAMVRVRLADGTTDVVLGEKLSNVQETDMSALVAEDYAMTFAEEDAMETLGEVEQTLFDMQRTGASNTQQIRAVEKAGLTVFNEGEVVTLLNGEEATVVEGFRHGLYTVMRADGSLSMVGVGGILQPDVAMAQAQRSVAMPQEQTPLTQSTPLPEGIDTTTDYATPDGFVGKAVDYNAESDQVTLQSADGGLTNVPRASLTVANAEQIAPQEDATENLATETISEMEQGEAEETPMPTAPQTAPIPQNADGSVDYESITDATMYANALESDMGNVADAQEAVVDVRQSKEAELAKLQEQKKQTANMNEKVALKQQEQKLVQQIAMLNEVESILGSRETAVEAETAQVNEAVETAPIAEATTEQTAPTTEPTRAIVEGVKENDFATQLRNENPAEYNTFNALAKLLGLEIEFVESAGEGNALIVGNKMQVAYNPANREEALRFLIGHESLHRLKQVAPEAYAELMEDVKAHLGEELFGRRKERLQQRYDKQGIAITEESLEEEVVADFIGEMEEDYNVVSDLVTNNPNKSWWQKLIEGLRNLFSFLEEASADTTKVASILNKIETAYKAAAEKVQTLEVETVNGEVSAEINEAEGQAKLSIRTYEEGGRATLVDFLQKQQAKDALTAEEADDILAQMDNLYTICKDYKDKYAPFGQWSDASVVVGEDGKPVFSVIKKNGEYAMNLDFSLVCKKRRTLDAVLNEMVKRGLIEGISVSETTIAKINEVIRRYGFETACALCFVDARRFRVLKVAKDFADLYNSVVDKLIPKGSNIAVNEFNYGGREGVVEKENALDTMADESLNISALQKMSEGKSVKARIAQHLLDKPQDRKYVTPSDFVSTAGFDNVAAHNVPLLKLYNAKKGTGGPKAAFSDVQYLNDIARKNWSVEDAFAVGGVRIQSFSDFVPRMVFDYMQMVAELAGKRLPAHAYTKEAIFAKMFGLTGIKINLSLVPDVVEGGVAAGLDANGDYVWRDGETFPYEEAVALQNAEGYKENCGTIAVGVSDEHILKMLDDPHIRMVIPYHKSGLNPLVAKMNNIGAYKDYTKEQSTRTAKGNSRTKEQKAQLPEPSFNELLRESNSPMEAAQKYLDWCKEHNLKPKFDRFASHPNYYKLLEDFTTYVDGAYVPQRSVTMTYPTASDAFGSISELIAQGLEEDAILEGQRDAKVSQMVDEIEGAKYSLRNPEWQSQFGVSLADGKELSLEDVRTIFERTNKRKVLQQMFDKVYEVMEKLPYYGIIVTSQMPEGSEDSLGVADGKGNILLNVRMFQEISNKGIATTILHEMIHSATTYATIAYEERKENPEAYKALPENIKTACQRLQNIYDFLLKRNNLKEEYGMTSIHEMLAELSNPQFRALLREEGVWEKLINALKRFFGIGTGKTVKELDETLKTFLENFDRSAYVETVESIAGEKVFERKPFGGNSGYVGYSMSKRAAYAREEGRYPKTDFKKVYNMPQATLDALVSAGIITDKEWHHTSSYGNTTTFYGWGEYGESPYMSEYYKANKAEIDEAVKNGDDLSTFIQGFEEYEADVKANEDYLATLKAEAEAERKTLEQQEEQAMKERIAEANRQLAEADARNAYIRANMPQEYVASNGVTIRPNEYGELPAYRDGEALTSTSSSNKRKAASKARAEFREQVIKPLEEQYNALKETDNQGKEVKYSLKSLDAPYLDAVERGDMATAERMVREAAAIAMPNTKVVDKDGLPKVVYHGTGSEFYTFRNTSDINELGAGYYFSDSYEMAERYATDETLADNRFRVEALAFDIFTDEMGHSEEDYDDIEFEDDYNEAYALAVERLFGNGRVMSVFLNIENPRILSRVSPDFDPVYQYGFNYHNEGAMAKRYNDGVIDEMFTERHNGLTGNQYVVFNPNQIKSADVVTYDDAGNIIPLSERFNPEKEDIRYSLRDDVRNILDAYDLGDDYRNYGTIHDVADRIEEVVDDYDGEEDITQLRDILNAFRYAQEDASNWGERMDSGGEEDFENALRLYASQPSYSLREATDEKLTPAMIRHHMMENITRHHEQEVNRINRFYDREERQAKALAKKARKEAGLVYPKNGKITDRLAFLIPDGKTTLPMELQVTYDIANGLKLKWSDSKDGRKHGLSSELGLGSSRKEGYGAITVGATMYVEDYVAQLMEENNGYSRDLDDNDIRNAVINVLSQYTKPKQAIQALEDIFLSNEMDDVEAEALYKIDLRRQESLEEENARYEGLKTSYERNPRAFERDYFEQMEKDVVALNFKEREIRRLKRDIKALRNTHNKTYREQAERIQKVREAIDDFLKSTFGRNISTTEVKRLFDALQKATTQKQLERVIEAVSRMEKRTTDRIEQERKRRLLKMKLSFFIPADAISLEEYLKDENQKASDAAAIIDYYNTENSDPVMNTFRIALKDRYKGKDSSGVSVAKLIDAETAEIMAFISTNATRRDIVEANLAEETAKLYEAKEKLKGKLPFSQSTMDKIDQAYEVVLNYWEADIKRQGAVSYNKAMRELSIEIEMAKKKRDEAQLAGSDELYELAVAEVAGLMNEARELAESHYDGMGKANKILMEANDAVERLLLGGRRLLSEEREAKRKHDAEVLRDAINDITNYGEEYKELNEKAHDQRKASKDKEPSRLKRIHSEWADSLEYLLNVMAPYAPEGSGLTYQRIIGGALGAASTLYINTKVVNMAVEGAIKRIWGGKMKHNTLPKLLNQSQQIVLAENYAIGYYEETEDGKKVKKPRRWCLTMGNAIYLLAMWEQPDSHYKLTANGVTQEVIDDVTSLIANKDARWIEFKNWVVDELLPARREVYDETHRKVQGTYMAESKNYFPIHILSQDRHQEEKASEEKAQQRSIKPSGIKQRVYNTNMIDLNVDFVKALMDNLYTMEMWAAIAPVEEDMNVILSNNTAKNLMNAKFGADFSQRLKTAMQVTVGTLTSGYINSTEKFFQDLTRRWGGTKIAFGINTALKQLAGAGAMCVYTADLRFLWYLAKNIQFLFTPKSAQEFFPMLQKRWEEGLAGNIGLKELFRSDVTTSSGFDIATENVNRVTTDIVKLGMIPNKIVDMAVCAMMAKSVYEYEYNRYIKQGYSKDMAEKKAMIDAESSYNKTQQSSEMAFLSSGQVSSNILNRSLNIFMNNSIANYRIGVMGIEDIKKGLFRFKKAQRNMRKATERRLFEQYTASGMAEEEARAKAQQEADIITSKLSRSSFVAKGIFRSLWGFYFANIVFGFMGIAPYLLFGDDDDKKEELIIELMKSSIWTPLTLIPTTKAIYETFAYAWKSSEEGRGYQVSIAESLFPMLEDVDQLITNSVGAVADIADGGDMSYAQIYNTFDALLRMGVGVDTNRMFAITDGFIDLGNGDWLEGTLDVLSVPKSQIKLLTGDRKDGETAKEYMTRVMRTMSIVDKNKIDVAELENFNFETGKWEKPTNISAAEKRKVSEIYNQYQAEYKKDMLKRCSEEVRTNYPEVVEKHAEILKDMGVRDTKLALVRYYEQMVDTLTPEAASALERLAVLQAEISATERSLDLMVSQDGKEYIDLLTEEFNLRKAFVAQYEIYENLTK